MYSLPQLGFLEKFDVYLPLSETHFSLKKQLALIFRCCFLYFILSQKTAFCFKKREVLSDFFFFSAEGSFLSTYISATFISSTVVQTLVSLEYVLPYLQRTPKKIEKFTRGIYFLVNLGLSLVHTNRFSTGGVFAFVFAFFQLQLVNFFFYHLDLFLTKNTFLRASSLFLELNIFFSFFLSLKEAPSFVSFVFLIFFVFIFFFLELSLNKVELEAISVKGFKRTQKFDLMYTSTTPLLLVSYIFFWLKQSLYYVNLPFLASYSEEGSLVGGLLFYLTKNISFEGFLHQVRAAPLQSFCFFLLSSAANIGLTCFISFLWLYSSQLSPELVASQIFENKFCISGIKKTKKSIFLFLEKSLNSSAFISGFVLGFFASIFNFTGIIPGNLEATTLLLLASFSKEQIGSLSKEENVVKLFFEE